MLIVSFFPFAKQHVFTIKGTYTIFAFMEEGDLNIPAALVLEYEPTRYTAKSIIYICLFDYFTYVESSPTMPQFITIN